MNIPDVRRYVGTCMGCHSWQVDVRPGAVSDLGGAQPAAIAMVEAHAAHQVDCLATAGRIRYEGHWVDAPRMQDGATATSALQMDPFPAWWVTR